MSYQSDREKIILIETTQQRIDCFEDNNEIIDHLMTFAERLENTEFKNEVYWLREACENLEGLMCIITGQD
mgnify:FL=1|tara:strand:- start:131 stop:343 length:213 start_codon:yes stop_codon:yes gene_type:complete